MQDKDKNRERLIQQNFKMIKKHNNGQYSDDEIMKYLEENLTYQTVSDGVIKSVGKVLLVFAAISALVYFLIVHVST
jgi:hypothetical protein